MLIPAHTIQTIPENNIAVEYTEPIPIRDEL